MSGLCIYARIAFRNLLRNRRRSFSTVLAVSFGLFCLIVFQALKVGLHRQMTDGTVLLETGSVQVHGAGYESNLTLLRPVPAPELVAAALHRLGVSSFSSRLRAPALVLSGAGSSTVLISGVDPAAEQRVTGIAGRLVRGRYLSSDDRVLIGAELAESLGIAPGGGLTLLAQDPFGRPVSRRFVVCGVYRTELASFNRSRVFLPLVAAQRFLRSEGVVSEVAAISERDREETLAAELRQALAGGGYQVMTWRQVAPDLSQLIEMNDATMHVLILIVFTIVALGITNTMTMIIYERFRELGVLAAIGTPPTGILAMVALESLFLGLFSAVVGSLAGVAASVWLSVYGLDLTSFTSSNQYFAMTHVIRAHLQASDLLLANGVTLATALLAGLYPAWKGARLDPVQALGQS